MPLLLRHMGREICFIHIPKTGGTSVRLEWGDDASVLSPYHCSLQKAVEMVGHGMEYWSILREPLDRLRSLYDYYLTGTDPRNKDWQELTRRSSLDGLMRVVAGRTEPPMPMHRYVTTDTTPIRLFRFQDVFSEDGNGLDGRRIHTHTLQCASRTQPSDSDVELARSLFKHDYALWENAKFGYSERYNMYDGGA